LSLSQSPNTTFSATSTLRQDKNSNSARQFVEIFLSRNSFCHFSAEGSVNFAEKFKYGR